MYICMSFSAIRENKILAKISGFTVYALLGNIENNHVGVIFYILRDVF